MVVVVDAAGRRPAAPADRTGGMSEADARARMAAQATRERARWRSPTSSSTTTATCARPAGPGGRALGGRCRRPRAGPGGRRDALSDTPSYGGARETDHRPRAPRRARSEVDQRLPARPATSRRRSTSWSAGSGRASATSCCSAPPAPASRRPPPGWSSGCSGPTLVMAPNKTLAAQLANEFRELLPQQRGRVLRLLLRLLPARGVRPADGHLHREGLLDQRRGRAAAALGDQVSLLTRRDVIVVASVSCIYGLGTPQEYVDRMVRLAGRRHEVERDQLLRQFVDDAVHPQRPGVHPRHVPGARRHDRDLPGLRGARRPDRDVRRRDRAAR